MNATCSFSLVNFDSSPAQVQERREQLPFISISLGIACFGVIANLHVMIILWKYFNNETFMIYLKLLSICDFLSCLGMIWKNYGEYLTCPLIYYGISIGCGVSNFLIFTVAEWSMFLICLISYDRFVNICRPLQSKPSNKKAWILSFCCFLICFLNCFPFIFLYGNRSIIIQNANHSETVLMECGISDEMKDSLFPEIYFVGIDSLGLFLPTIVMICYIKIWRAVATSIRYHKELIPKTEFIQNNENGAENTVESGIQGIADNRLRDRGRSESRRQSVSKNKRKETTTKLVLIATLITILFFISKSCILVIETSKAFEEGIAQISRFRFTMYRFCMNAAYLNSIFNPFVYFLNDAKFRKGIKNLYHINR